MNLIAFLTPGTRDILMTTVAVMISQKIKPDHQIKPYCFTVLVTRTVMVFLVFCLNVLSVDLINTVSGEVVAL